MIQAMMDKHKGEIVSLQDLVTFCDNLEKELKIQDKLFEQPLHKHHHLTTNKTKLPEQDTMDPFEDTISTLSATDGTPRYFPQLMLKEIYKMLTLIEDMLIENELPLSYILIAISKIHLIA
uniref:Uncharacterized protein n=1 Tax=Romanomermis culicivorax TaxID=13658 RepID=A0A915ISB4_ROMCU